MADLLLMLPRPFQKILQQVRRAADRAQVPVYLVGGPVRDLLMQRACADLDVAVEGDALALAKNLAQETSAKVVFHPRFGTANLTWDNGARLDLAMTRTETYAQPAALPEVTSAGIEDDLRRRDFSINALAMRLNIRKRGEILDFFNGRADLKQKRIRILHAQSFIDDPTRILRAVRFEQRLGFKLETQTQRRLAQAVAQGLLAKLSPARIKHEWRLVLQESDPQAVIRRLEKLRVLAEIQPGLG
jgi:tRNA nucleotidyltransferase (CCA-adding enzyme)